MTMIDYTIKLEFDLGKKFLWVQILETCWMRTLFT